MAPLPVHRLLSWALAVSVAVFAGCAAAPRQPPAVVASTPVAELPPLPRYIVATAQTVLRLPEDPKVRLAFPRFKLPLRVRAEAGGLVAEVDGAIRVSGTAKLEELGVFMCEAGPVGSHFYAGTGNLLTLRSGVRGGRVRVAGVVNLRLKPYAEGTPFREQFGQVPFEAEVDAAHLCTAPLPSRHVFYGFGEPDEEDFPPGTQVVDIDRGAPLELLDAPGGVPLHTFPATERGFPLMGLRTEGAWDLVAAGDGPYLLGWIPTRAPWHEPSGAIGGVLGGLVGGVRGSWTLHTKKLAALPFHELPAGTVLQQLGVPRANLLKPGYGRIVGPPSGRWSYVIAAVDDDVTVEGWVETSKLGPLVPATK